MAGEHSAARAAVVPSDGQVGNLVAMAAALANEDGIDEARIDFGANGVAEIDVITDADEVNDTDATEEAVPALLAAVAAVDDVEIRGQIHTTEAPVLTSDAADDEITVAEGAVGSVDVHTTKHSQSVDGLHAENVEISLRAFVADGDNEDPLPSFVSFRDLGDPVRGSFFNRGVGRLTIAPQDDDGAAEPVEVTVVATDSAGMEGEIVIEITVPE